MKTSIDGQSVELELLSMWGEKDGRPVKMFRCVPKGLRPNTWNPNVMNQYQEAALDRSVNRLGLIQPIIVREIDTGLEIVDGFHRWKAAQKYGMNDLPIISLGRISDIEAKRFLVVLNETKGESTAYDLAKIVSEVIQASPDVNIDELGFPWSDKKIKDFLAWKGDEAVVQQIERHEGTMPEEEERRPTAPKPPTPASTPTPEFTPASSGSQTLSFSVSPEVAESYRDLLSKWAPIFAERYDDPDVPVTERIFEYMVIHALSIPLDKI